MLRSVLAALFLLIAARAAFALPDRMTEGDRAIPPFAHVFVIVEENKNYEQILDPNSAPNIADFARTYGNAAAFYAEVHPSEANYVALLGGDTFGIHDDDAFYCRPRLTIDRFCLGAMAPGYPNHTTSAPHIGDQLASAGKTWKGYYESIPAPGSLAVVASAPEFGETERGPALYASKHSGFLNFASVQGDPHRGEHIVGFEQLEADILADRLPDFALIVPNQCNDMHGLKDERVPSDCNGSTDLQGLIRRGDAMAGRLVKELQSSKPWKSSDNVAIIITFDEASVSHREGCCAVTPDAPSNYGGGHIPTIVITNHGPRGLEDKTPYNHYSLLRTIEDALGVHAHLRHAGDLDAGVFPMTPLFVTNSLP